MPDVIARHAVDLLLSLAALPLAASCGYLGLLTLASRRRASASAPAPRLRFEVVVPAHDEQAGVAETVRSLLAVRYPREDFGVVVVADNCSDRTAAVAAAAGASVLVRDDPEHRGKGHALRFAYDHVLARGVADAVVVVDADSVVSANLLSALAASLARGSQALQVDYGVRNPAASWRTRLLAIAFGAMHGVRSLGRERLGLSCGLRGNGMAFSTRVLREVPHEAWSIVEDLEYGIALGRAGHRVGYVADAQVLGQMPASAAASRSQRRRWEGGRLAIKKRYAWPLVRRGLRLRSPLLMDLGVDLLVPPLATLALWAAAVLGVCVVAAALGAPTQVSRWLWIASAGALLAHILRGWSLSGVGTRGLADLLLAPLYVAWKVGLRLMPAHAPAGEWIRTKRPGEE